MVVIFSKLASGRNPPNPDKFRERAVFTILPANQDGIVDSFIHKFVCCL